jgi:hypothetical protein
MRSAQLLSLRGGRDLFRTLLVTLALLLSGRSLFCTDKAVRQHEVFHDAIGRQDFCRADQQSPEGCAFEGFPLFEIPYNPASFTIRYFATGSSAALDSFQSQSPACNGAAPARSRLGKTAPGHTAQSQIDR